MMYDISMERLLAAAQDKYGPSAQVGAPYWISDEGFVRVAVTLDGWNGSAGANYWYKEGRFI